MQVLLRKSYSIIGLEIGTVLMQGVEMLGHWSMNSSSSGTRLRIIVHLPLALLQVVEEASLRIQRNRGLFNNRYQGTTGRCGY